MHREQKLSLWKTDSALRMQSSMHWQNQRIDSVAKEKRPRGLPNCRVVYPPPTVLRQGTIKQHRSWMCSNIQLEKYVLNGLQHIKGWGMLKALLKSSLTVTDLLLLLLLLFFFFLLLLLLHSTRSVVCRRCESIIRYFSSFIVSLCVMCSEKSS